MDAVALMLLAPIVLPLATALAALALWNHLRRQRIASVAGSALLLASTTAMLIEASSGRILVLQAGDWPAPFGITLAVDILGASMAFISALTLFAVAVYSLADIDHARESHGYHPLLHFMMMGIGGAFVTGDLFNLYVWFEVLLIGSFVLMALGGERQQMEGSLKYVTLSLISSALFLVGTGLTYGLAGTLNMADLAVVLPRLERPALTTSIAAIFLLAFGIKAAVFPLFFWLPASYHTPPAAVSAIFSGLLTKVGVYALIRVFTLLFPQGDGSLHGLILVLSGLTMITGVLGAVAQNEFRRILSFHIISQIGYMIMGLGLFTAAALAGSVFYVMHHIIVKTNLFLISGLVRRLGGSYKLKSLGGVYLTQPLIALAFLIPAFSLAGVPPLSGFWAKFLLLRAGLEIESYVIVAVALVVGLLTLFSMTKIWNEVFWKEAPAAGEPLAPLSRAGWLCYGAPIALLALCTLAIGLAPQPMLELMERAAAQLIDPSDYIRAVLAERG